VSAVAEQKTTDLALIVSEQGLAVDRAKPLLDVYSPFFASAQALLEKSRAITVTDATQVAQIKAARSARLALREVRVEAEKKRKELKEESLRTGKAIDGIANVLKLMLEPEEARLEECEKFAERVEAARIAALVAARTERLRPFGVDPLHYGLREMTDEAFDQLVGMLSREREAKLEAERKAAEAAEKARQEREAEEARIRAENARLKAEADAARKEQERRDAEARAERERIEAEAKKERDRLAAEARAEREARERAEREAREAREAAERAEADRKAAEAAEAKKRAAAEAKAKRAPDREKVKTLAAGVRAVVIPEATTPEGIAAMRRAANMLRDVSEAIERLASEL
jgi:hypothetical protein